MKERNQLFEGIQKRTVSLFGISYKKLAILLAVIIGLGIYLGILIFGENSLIRYMEVKQQMQEYQLRKQQLRRENAGLQKEYFELKEIQPKEEP